MEPLRRFPEVVPYKNKQRVLVFSTRGITARYRHLMEDLRRLIPHHKKDVKLDAKDFLNVINEIATIKSCNSCLFFEVRKKRDLFLWMSKTPAGPSVKFHVLNVHTMDELRLTGNCLKGSRPFLSFDAGFGAQPHLRLLREMFCQVFNVPRGHPKSQPFFDHVLGFYIVDNKIWVRHYQIVANAQDQKTVKKVLAAGEDPVTLVEIGPRFVLDIIRVFQGSFGGPTIYQNAHYVSPNKVRHEISAVKGTKYKSRVEAEEVRAKRHKANELEPDEVAGVFKIGGGKRKPAEEDEDEDEEGEEGSDDEGDDDDDDEEGEDEDEGEDSDE